MRAILKSNLNRGNVVKAINIWAVATERHGAGVINWNIEELDRMDRKKTTKLLKFMVVFIPDCWKALYSRKFRRVEAQVIG